MQGPTRTPSTLRLLAALGTALACGPLLAATANGTEQAEAKSRHDREVAACRSGQSPQALAACLDEAKSAYAEARRGVLGDGMEVDADAAMKRCEALEGDERTACVARMNGQGTTSGSVGAGGIYRELVTREKVPATAAGGTAAKPMPKSMPTPMPMMKDGSMAPKASGDAAVKPKPQ